MGQHPIPANLGAPTKRDEAFLIEYVLRFGQTAFSLKLLKGEKIRSGITSKRDVVSATLSDHTLLNVRPPAHGFLSVLGNDKFIVTQAGTDYVSDLLRN